MPVVEVEDERRLKKLRKALKGSFVCRLRKDGSIVIARWPRPRRPTK